MKPRKKISELVKKKLYALSGNQCCFPDCKERVYNLEEEASIGEICHINAVNPSGPRYNQNLSEEEVNFFENIILLCPTHHSYIDKNETKYPASVLVKMKEEHERKFYHNASKFDDLFEEKEGEIDVARLDELKAIDSVSEMVSTEPVLPIKKQYPPTKNYITRYLTSVKDNFDFTSVSKTLTETIKEVNHITILGVAGSGKSMELSNAAYIFSQLENDYYPIKVRLNTLTNQSIEEYLILEYPNLLEIPHEKLLILLDGLDEVHSNYIDIVTSNIFLFKKKFNASKIVVSCRNNLYTTETDKRNAKIEGFVSYIIKPLEYYSIYTYLEDKIEIDPELFIEDLRKKKFFDLLYSPFYLVNLVDYYNTKKTIPGSKKIVFDYLITQRIESDYDKFENSGVQIQNHKIKVEKCIEKLAVAAECLGKNYLDEQSEVLEIISDDKLFNIIKRTFLFNKSIEESKRWEFEHNNFQEFLAARFLSRLSIQEIKKYVSFEPEFNKIKPSWLNTVSFLFSILDFGSNKFSELIDWIQKIEPDILVRFEKDKIDLPIREKLFKRIYKEYEDKGILIRNEKFESEDLALFVSDSKEIIDYIVSKITVSNDKLIISEALRMLPYFDSINEYNNTIKQVINDKLSQSKLADEIKYYCLNTLAKLKIFEKDFTEKILNYFDLDSSPYLRAGFYNYLRNSDDIDNYIDIILNGIELIENDRGVGDRIYDEKFNLDKLIDKIESPKTIKKALDWSTEYKGSSLGDNMFFEMIQKILTKSAKSFNEGNSFIFESVYCLLLVFSKRHYRERQNDFKEFFKVTKTEIIAFKRLLVERNYPKADTYSYDTAIALLCNEDCVNFLVGEVKEGGIIDVEAVKIRNLLGWSGEKEIHDLFQKELEKINKKLYSYKKVVDFNEIQKNRRKKDLELLFNYPEFMREIKDTFKEEASDKLILTYNQLCDYKKKRFSEEEMTNNLVVDLLRERSRNKGTIEFIEIEKLFQNKDNWKWYTLHKLVDYDTNYEDFQFNDKAIDFIEKWVYNEIEEVDFYSAIEMNDPGSYHYRFKELYISYFTQRLDLNIKKESLLDFLLIDCYLLPRKKSGNNDQEEDSKLSFTQKFLIEKCGKEEVINQIVTNLKSKKLIPVVKQVHYNFCLALNVTEISFIILEDILKPDLQEHERSLLIDQFIELSGDCKKLFDIIDELPNESKFYLIKILTDKKYIPIEEYIINLIVKEENESVKLRLIQFLMKVSNSLSFSLLKDWVIRNKTLPDHFIGYNKNENVDLNDLIEIFDDSLLHKYGEDKWTNRNEFLTPIIELGSKDENNYFRVRDKLNFWIGKYDNMNYLYYQLQKLEQLFYSKKSQTLDFNEVLNLINKKPQETIIQNPK